MKFSLLLFLFSISSICYGQVRVTIDERTNSLIIRAPKEQHQQIKRIVEQIDDPYESKIVKVVALKYIYSEDIVPVLSNVMNVLKPYSSRSSTFDPAYSGMVLGDSRTNQIILISDRYTNDKMECIINQLDKKIKLENNVFLQKLKNAKALDISNIVNGISRK